MEDIPQPSPKPYSPGDRVRVYLSEAPTSSITNRACIVEDHRGSVFRERVGEARGERHNLDDEYPEWGDGSSAERDLRLEELEMERRVSDYLCQLPFLWIDVPDDPGPGSERAYLERNAIALLSNYGKPPIDLRLSEWLGNDSPSQKIRESGLWNVNHVDESYAPAFLDQLAGAIEATEPP